MVQGIEAINMELGTSRNVCFIREANDSPVIGLGSIMVCQGRGISDTAYKESASVEEVCLL